MAENVIFDNSDPNAAPPQDPAQAPPGSEGVPPDGTVPPGDGTEEVEYEEVPAPTGIAALLGPGWKKKVLIALGILIIIIIIIILIIPKNQRGKDIELTWWGLWEDNTVMQPLIDGFEKQHPNIKIKYTKQDSEKYRETLMTRINNGSGPDIFRYHNTWVPMFSGVLAPLPKDVITAEDFTKQYYPVTQKDVIQNGAIYGIPLGIDCLALFINTDLLNKAGNTGPPEDWNQFKKVAQRMTVKDPDTKKIQIAGAALGTYGNITHAADILSMFFLQLGVNPNKIVDSKDSLSTALMYYTSYSKGEDAVWDNSLDNSQLAFARGQLAMYFGFSWDIFAIEQIKSNNFKYAIYPVPYLEKDKNISTASYWVEGVSSRSKNQKEAMLFMNYLTQKETLQRFYTEASKTRAFGEPYPRVDMADELKNNKTIYPFISQLNLAGSTYFASRTHDGETGLNSRANSYLTNLLNAIVMDNTSVDTALKAFLEGMSKVLYDNGIQ